MVKSMYADPRARSTRETQGPPIGGDYKMVGEVVVKTPWMRLGMQGKPAYIDPPTMQKRSQFSM